MRNCFQINLIILSHRWDWEIFISSLFPFMLEDVLLCSVLNERLLRIGLWLSLTTVRIWEEIKAKMICSWCFKSTFTLQCMKIWYEENIFALNIMSSTTRTSAQDLCYSEVISSKTLYIPILDIVFVTFSLLSGKIKKWEA